MVENISITNLSYRGDTGGIEEAIDDAPLQTDSKFYDEDGRVKRTGTVWTTCSHMIQDQIHLEIDLLILAIFEPTRPAPRRMVIFPGDRASVWPDFHNTWWLSIVAAVMFFFHSTIALALGISKVAETGTVMGSLTGISIGTVTPAQKVWGVFQALGNIAFAYYFILLEIQDTIKSPPSEGKAMKKAAKSKPVGKTKPAAKENPAAITEN